MRQLSGRLIPPGLMLWSACDSGSPDTGEDPMGPAPGVEPARVQFIASPPAMLGSNEPFEVRVRVVDRLGNVASTAAGE